MVQTLLIIMRKVNNMEQEVLFKELLLFIEKVGKL